MNIAETGPETVIYPAGPINIYNVPAKQWRKWTDDAQAMFNYLYAEAKNNERVLFALDTFNVEDAVPLTKIINAGAWNLAWLAADKLSAK